LANMGTKPASCEERVQPRKENARRETRVQYVVVTLAVGLEAVKIACSYVLLFYEEENVLWKIPHCIVMSVKETIRCTQNFEKGFIDVFAMRVLRGLFQETAAIICGVVVLWAWLKDTQQHQLI